MLAQPLAGLAGLGAMGTKALGMTNTPAADVVRSVQSNLTYSPKTQAGQNVSNVLGYLPQKLASAADTAGGKVTDWTGSPLAGAAVNTAIQGAMFNVMQLSEARAAGATAALRPAMGGRRRHPALAGLFYAIYPYLIFQNLTLIDTPFFMTLLYAFVLLMVLLRERSALDKGTWGLAMLAGVVLGLSMLTRALLPAQRVPAPCPRELSSPSSFRNRWTPRRPSPAIRSNANCPPTCSRTDKS
jgi:hypothetical protein